MISGGYPGHWPIRINILLLVVWLDGLNVMEGLGAISEFSGSLKNLKHCRKCFAGETGNSYAASLTSNCDSFRPPVIAALESFDFSALIMISPLLLPLRDRLRGEEECSLKPAFQRLIAEADTAISQPLRTVLDKLHTAPSGDRQDYYSIGRYYWPPEKEASQEKWILRDGEISPVAMEAGDFLAWTEMARAVETLGVAWFYTQEATYAERAVQWIKAWFSDSATRMNPHFRYSAAAPGYHDGGRIGLIEAVEALSFCLNGIVLLEDSHIWSAELDSAVKEWMEAFLLWMMTDPNATPALEHPNNIGTWTEVLAARLNWFLGRPEAIRERAAIHLPARIAAHLEPDGSQPPELKRTLSHHYCCYHLQAFQRWAEMASLSEMDLWRFTTPDGRSIRQALLFMVKSQPWPFPNIKDPDLGKVAELLEHYLLYVGDDEEVDQALGGFRERGIQNLDSRRHLLAGRFSL